MGSNLRPWKNDPSITDANSSTDRVANVGRFIRSLGTPRAASLPVSTAVDAQQSRIDQAFQQNRVTEHVGRKDRRRPFDRAGHRRGTASATGVEEDRLHAAG